MAGPAVAAAPVYVAGAAVVAGAVWLLTPAGRRASESMGEAMVEGGQAAVDNITSLFAGEREEAPAVPVPTTATNTSTRGCDGPHRGRMQVQGYNRRVDPRDFTTMIPPVTYAWNQPCIPPLRAMGLAQLSTNLLVQTQNISTRSAGWRAGAFSRMSQYIRSSPPPGFTPANSRGWSITPEGRVVRNFGPGAAPNAPRVDLDVMVGRAFGDF